MTELQDALKFARLRPDCFLVKNLSSDKRDKQTTKQSHVPLRTRAWVCVSGGGKRRGGEGGACKTVKARSIKERGTKCLQPGQSSTDDEDLFTRHRGYLAAKTHERARTSSAVGNGFPVYISRGAEGRRKRKGDQIANVHKSGYRRNNPQKQLKIESIVVQFRAGSQVVHSSPGLKVNQGLCLNNPSPLLSLSYNLKRQTRYKFNLQDHTSSLSSEPEFNTTLFLGEGNEVLYKQGIN